jgi:Flp pilus assembly protein TadG
VKRNNYSKPCGNRRLGFRDLLHDESGVAFIYMTVCIPVVMGFAALAIEGSHAIVQRNMLQITAEAAALAATAQLPNDSVVIATAQTYASKNMPAASYGNVLASSDVAIGQWTQGCATGGANCFVAGALPPNAVRVTTRRASSNGNQIPLFFGSSFKSFDISASAIATFGYGAGSGAQATWNAIIVEDISSSFSSQLTNARAADKALLDCMKQNAAIGSKLGITLFTGVSQSPAYQVRIPVTDAANYNILKNKISGINECGSSGMPICSGSNAAVGINSAISQFCPSKPCAYEGPVGSRQALVIVTDGIPNCGNTPNCSGTTLKANAVSAANAAASKGIDVYTIYYGTSTSDAAWLATLVRGNGIALTTPQAAQLPTLMQQVCAQMPHRLVW